MAAGQSLTLTAWSIIHPPMKKVTLLCIGAGGRGTGYCTFALAQPDRLQVVGVAEPRELFRQQLVDPVLHDGVGLAAANLHDGPGPRGDAGENAL